MILTDLLREFGELLPIVLVLFENGVQKCVGDDLTRLLEQLIGLQAVGEKFLHQLNVEIRQVALFHQRQVGTQCVGDLFRILY